MPSDLVELGDSNPRPPACKEQAGCGMPSLTWPNALRKVGEQGSLSRLVVVRTVVSVQFACSRDVSGAPPIGPSFAF